MTPAMRTAVFVSVMLFVWNASYAQSTTDEKVTTDKPAEKADGDKPADAPPARTTGLPSNINWTLNFDAGWGSFGFANSLFNNPKEPGVEENLSDQWFEGYIKPALSATYTLASTAVIYGKVSAVGERTYGSIPEAFGRDVLHRL